MRGVRPARGDHRNRYLAGNLSSATNQSALHLGMGRRGRHKPLEHAMRTIAIKKSARQLALDEFSNTYWFSFMQAAFKPIRFLSRQGAPMRRVR